MLQWVSLDLDIFLLLMSMDDFAHSLRGSIKDCICNRSYITVFSCLDAFVVD
jgi:hypothetical protein